MTEPADPGSPGKWPLTGGGSMVLALKSQHKGSRASSFGNPMKKERDRTVGSFWLGSVLVFHSEL